MEYNENICYMWNIEIQSAICYYMCLHPYACAHEFACIYVSMMASVVFKFAIPGNPPAWWSTWWSAWWSTTDNVKTGYLVKAWFIKVNAKWLWFYASLVTTTTIVNLHVGWQNSSPVDGTTSHWWPLSHSGQSEKQQAYTVTICILLCIVYNLYVHYPRPVESLTLYGSAAFFAY